MENVEKDLFILQLSKRCIEKESLEVLSKRIDNVKTSLGMYEQMKLISQGNENILKMHTVKILKDILRDAIGSIGEEMTIE